MSSIRTWSCSESPGAGFRGKQRNGLIRHPREGEGLLFGVGLLFYRQQFLDPGVTLFAESLQGLVVGATFGAGLHELRIT